MVLDGGHDGAEEGRAVRVHNPDGSGPFVIVCDHASNFIPAEFGTLGLPQSDLTRHIAWDPGALAVSLGLSELLDAPLVQSCISRLVIDCNRPLNAANLFWAVSEDTVIPGNQAIDDADRARRIALAYDPFHAAIDDMLRKRLAREQPTTLVGVHSFTPVYHHVIRPWQIGIIHDDDDRVAAPLIEALRQHKDLTVGVNEPYSPADKVYFTLERHARSRGLPCVMIEIRNDEIASPSGVARWVNLLAPMLEDTAKIKENVLAAS